MIRMTQEAFEAHQARVKPASAPRVPVSREEALRQRAEKKAKGAGRNKYGAKKTTVDNIVFDSKAEAQRYIQLKAMEKAGQIVDLRIQVEYELLPAQVVDGSKIKPCFYRCDFEYLDKDGTLVTEDVKSGPTKTAEYRVKAKMFAFRYGRVIREVLMND